MDTTKTPERPSSSRPVRDDSKPSSTTERHSTGLRRIGFWTSLVVAPVAIGAGVGALLGSRRRGAIAGGMTAAALVLLRWQFDRLFEAEPAYEVEQRLGRLEIRRYAPRIDARTTVERADLEAALRQGFERLAAYIGGANGRHEQLAMATPVIARHRPAATTGAGDAPARDHIVSFVMPPGRTMDTLPPPDDERVGLVHEASERVAVLCYHGRRRTETIVDRERELMRLVAEAGLTPLGLPMYAGFDPPWTLPPLRRDEVWVRLAT